MHDPDAPPRLRWRVLGWSGTSIVLIAGLYVAMAGPVGWWKQWHPGATPLATSYLQSLGISAYTLPPRSLFEKYCVWWIHLPLPRSWQRAGITSKIDQLKRELAAMPARIAAAKTESESREKIERTIETLTEQAIMAEVRAVVEGQTAPDQSDIYSAIAGLRKSLEPPHPRNILDCGGNLRDEQTKLQAELLDAEQQLRQFDAQ